MQISLVIKFWVMVILSLYSKKRIVIILLIWIFSRYRLTKKNIFKKGYACKKFINVTF